jgi:hypothetical protein
LLESVLSALGWGMVGAGVLCVYAGIYLIVNFSDVEIGFPAGEGAIKFLKIVGIPFFFVAAITLWLPRTG